MNTWRFPSKLLKVRLNKRLANDGPLARTAFHQGSLATQDEEIRVSGTPWVDDRDISVPRAGLRATSYAYVARRRAIFSTTRRRGGCVTPPTRIYTLEPCQSPLPRRPSAPRPVARSFNTNPANGFPQGTTAARIPYNREHGGSIFLDTLTPERMNTKEGTVVRAKQHTPRSFRDPVHLPSSPAAAGRNTLFPVVSFPHRGRKPSRAQALLTTPDGAGLSHARARVTDKQLERRPRTNRRYFPWEAVLGLMR